MEQRDAVTTERPPLVVIVAANVRMERLSRGWSQEKLARVADLSRNTIAAIEDTRDPERSSNALRLDTLERIAGGMEIDAAALLVWKEEATRAYLRAVTLVSPGLAVVELTGGPPTSKRPRRPTQAPLVKVVPLGP